MEHVISGINHWILELPRALGQMSETETSHRPAPNKWSKKEIVGHLCDSAINNMTRFIKIQYEEQPYVIQTYDQDQWVSEQHYQEQTLEKILTLFIVFNQQIITILSSVPKEKLSYLCNIGSHQQETFEWLINDYLVHMEHHINNQILTRNKA
ncbi:MULTISPECIES: DinB family protein [Fictibacillus]|uniref:Metal-dependent hydrolase n=1 Tax=Fictibacillus enclensis TaxID=1017270 RepID=A0A0V8J2N3_9BACL|nr:MULTISPECIES: DinB family protein [Fictibacillus]KSU81171.1 metal-dependent hydrolase [Fictibacillus enclensis]RXZ00697.1 DinB family protein [Fictibacillus sp. S7]SCC35768.1 DinB superfamily protein [Fictibacillus enclensis]